MKLKKSKLKIPNLTNDEDELVIDASIIEANHEQLEQYLAITQSHLEQLKREIYSVLDTGFKDAHDYQVPGTDKLIIKPSDFLEKAYTIQLSSQSDSGEHIENRHQDYINAGLAFSKYCDEHSDTLDADTTLLNDAGKLIGAINSILSSIIRIKSNLQRKNYEGAGGMLHSMKIFTNKIYELASESKIIQTIPDNLLKRTISKIDDLLNYVANLFKSNEQINTEKFRKVKESYQSITTKSQESLIESNEQIKSSGPTKT